MKARLIGQGRPGGTRVYDLPQGEALLGTERGATVQVVSSGVSRRHARILWDGHHHYLEDLKGSNGTHLYGQVIYRERLQHLDVISLGRQCNLIYMVQGREAASTADSSESPTVLTESTRGPAAAAAVSQEPEAPTIVQPPRAPQQGPKATPKSTPPSESGTVAIRAGATPSPPPPPRDTEVDRDFLLRKSYKRPAVKGSTSGAGLNLPSGLASPAEASALARPEGTPLADSQPSPDRGAPSKKPPPAAAAKRDVPARLNGGASALPELPAPIRYVALVPDGEDGVPHVVTVGTITLGRSVFCDIVPDSEAVSRFHARVEYTGDEVVLHDGGSLNGTFVNGKRVKTAVLKDGDTLSLAGVHAYKIVMRSSEPVSAARRPPASTPPAPVRPTLATPIPKASQRLRAPAGEVKRVEPKATEVAPAPSGSPAVLESGSVAKWRSRLTGKWKTILEGKWLSKRDALEGDWLRAPEKSPEAEGSASEASGASSADMAFHESGEWSPAVGRDAPPNGGQSKDALRLSEPLRVVDVVLTGVEVKGHFSEPGAYLLGRTRSADLRVESTSVSRRHARLIISDDRTSVAIEDMESANGTSVNGQRVGRHRLADGDVVTLGGFPLKVRIKKR